MDSSAPAKPLYKLPAKIAQLPDSRCQAANTVVRSKSFAFVFDNNLSAQEWFNGPQIFVKPFHQNGPATDRFTVKMDLQIRTAGLGEGKKILAIHLPKEFRNDDGSLTFMDVKTIKAFDVHHLFLFGLLGLWGSPSSLSFHPTRNVGD
jgi:hypothetical protein